MFWPNDLKSKLRVGVLYVLAAAASWAQEGQSLFILLALGLPAASMLLGDDARDLYLMALEGGIALVAVKSLLQQGLLGRGHRSKRALHWAFVLCGLGGADLIYNFPGPLVPRYPRNHVADLLLLAVVFLLISMAVRGWQRRVGMGGILATWAMAMLTFKLQVVFVVRPLMQLSDVPGLAVANAWLYAAASALLLAVLLMRSSRAIDREEHLAAQGLLLMLASDFAQRHDAIMTVGAMGWGEAGWAAGLGLLVVALRRGKGQLPWRASSAQAPWRSARCVLGGLSFGGNVVLVAGAVSGGLLAITEGAQLTAVLWLVWIGWFVSNALAVRLHEAMERIGALMPAPHITWCHAQHPMTVALTPITPRTRLAEFDGWVARYNHLVQQLNPLIAQVSRHQEAYAYQRMAEHVAHDIRAPIAALQSALDALGNREAQSAGILRQAALRISDVAQKLLAARRILGHAPSPSEPASPAQTLAPAAPGQEVGESAPWLRVVELVRRDLALRHGEAWAKAVGFEESPVLLQAPMTEVVTVVTNLLDNSIEATPFGPGAVRVQVVRQGSGQAELHIIDRGCGMPQQVLAALGRRSITAGKKDGNGLGVLGASRAAQAWGGSLRFELPQQGGTQAILCVPQVALEPDVTGPAAPSDNLTVLLDDDPLVRAAWRLSAQHAGQQLICYSTPAACLSAAASLGSHTRFYLDTQLGTEMTGHDVARALLKMGHQRIVVMQSTGGGGQTRATAQALYPIIASKKAPFAASTQEAA